MISFEEEMITCWCDKGGEGEGGVGDKGGLSAEDKDGHVCQLHPSPFPGLSSSEEPSARCPAGLDKTQIAESHP